MRFLQKIQNKPENTRKRILWIAVIIVGLALLFWWIVSVKRSIQKFQEEGFVENLNFSEFKEKMEELPKMELPQISDEELKKIEEEMKKNNNLNNGQ